MSYSNIYKRIGKNYNIGIAAFRFAVIAKSCGLEIKDDDNIRPLKQEIYRSFISNEMTEQKERLLFLFGAGIIEEKILIQLMRTNKDISDILADAENWLTDQAQLDPEDAEQAEKIMDIDLFPVLLMCCVNSRHYKENSLTFDDAIELSKLDKVKIINGYVKIIDEELYQYLVTKGEKFGMLADNGNIITDETEENLLCNEYVRNNDIESVRYPFLLDPVNVIIYDKLYKKMYGKEFLEYADSNDVSVTEESYNKYIITMKKTFYIESFSRKRKICGDIVNRFDYLNDISQNIMKADNTAEIIVEIESEDETNEALTQKAVRKFRQSYPVDNDALLEITHANKLKRYKLSESGAEIVNDDFSRKLFDFNEVWHTLKALQADYPISGTSTTLEFSMEHPLIQNMPEDMRIFAYNIVVEQFNRQIERKKNPVISKLSDLKKEAEQEFSKQQQERDVKSALRTQRQLENYNKRQMRKPGVQSIQDTSGNFEEAITDNNEGE